MPRKKTEPTTEPRLDKTTVKTRTTFVVDSDTLERIRDVAYWERMNVKDVIKNFLEKELAAYEKKNGAIKPRPKDESSFI